MDKLQEYKVLLKEYNKVHSITSCVDDAFIQKNIDDSLYPMSFLDKEIKTALDIGTGAGFPGLIIAIKNPQIKYILSEPNLKKSAFLNLVKVKLSLKNVTVSSQRVEDLKTGTVDLITSRAVSDISQLLLWAKKLIDINTNILIYKGSSIDRENLTMKHQTISKGNRNYILIRGQDVF